MNKFKIIYRKFIPILKGESRPLATGPHQFTFRDWKVAAEATKTALSAKRIGILAAGIAYFATLAFFPLIAASVAIASFIINHQQLQSITTSIEGYLPSDIAQLITIQLNAAITNQASSAWIAVIGILISLFSISGAVINMISASNVSYERDESRGFIKLRLTSLGLMLMGAVAGVIVIGLLLLNQAGLMSFGVPAYLAVTISVLRWLVMAGLITIVLAIFYRYGPDRSNPHWQWVTWGSIIASVIWLLGTALFFIYARYFANFSESYSIFAGIIVLMTWFNLTSYIVLLGAEVNYRLENQTLANTTK